MSAPASMQVANTILAQLGGRRFLVMTGASNLMGDAASLTFRLPRRAAADCGINHIKITLEPNDTYTFVGLKVGRAKLSTVYEASGIYAEDLQRIFTSVTGLETSLGTMGAGPAD
jgi:hypothetical protein